MLDVSAERDEQNEFIKSLKKKIQKSGNEAQDLKRQYEEAMARNTELEKKQRRSVCAIGGGVCSGSRCMYLCTNRRQSRVCPCIARIGYEMAQAALWVWKH